MIIDINFFLKRNEKKLREEIQKLIKRSLSREKLTYK